MAVWSILGRKRIKGARREKRVNRERKGPEEVELKDRARL